MNNWNKYTFFQLILVMMVVAIFEPQRSFIAQIITGDSLFLAISFFSGREILKIPKLTTIDKYSFYVIISLSFYLLDLLTWSYLTIVWKTLALLGTCPSLQCDFFEIAEIQDILAWFHRKQKRSLQTVLCYSLSRIINSLAKINLQADPQISYSELMSEIQLKNSEPLWRFIKIFLVNSLIKILGHQDSYKMRLLKFFYQRGHVIEIPTNQGSILPTDRSLCPKEILRLVVYHRRWHYLYDPRVLNGLIELYQSNQTSYFREACLEVLADLRHRSLKFGTIWTFCSVLNRPWGFPIISVLLEVNWNGLSNLRNFNRPGLIANFKANWGTYIFKSLGILLYGSSLTGYLTGALISEYGPILDNQASNFLIAGIRERWPEWKLYVSHQNQYNWSIIKYTGTLVGIKYGSQLLTQIGLNDLGLIQTGSLTVISLMIRYSNPVRFWIWNWMVTWGWFSEYHLGHLLLLSMGLYLIINLKDYRETPVPQMNLNLHQSYYHKIQA